MDRDALEAFVTAFVDAFNRDDLDAAMEYFADDAVYDEFNGKRHHGKAAVREAFVPQFRGDFGKIRFDVEDVFVDADAGKVLMRWLCHLEGQAAGWRGLDVIHVKGGRITEKHTYAKARVPFVER